MLTTWAIVTGIAIGTLMILAFIAQMYRKVGPNEAFVVYGVGGTRARRCAPDRACRCYRARARWIDPAARG